MNSLKRNLLVPITKSAYISIYLSCYENYQWLGNKTKVGAENVDKRPLIFKWSDGSTINPKFFSKNQPDNGEKLVS